MRATAELRRGVTEREHAHGVCVLIAEEGQRPSSDRRLVFHLTRLGRRVLPDALVDEALDLVERFRLDRLVVREVEPQPVRRDE